MTKYSLTRKPFLGLLIKALGGFPAKKGWALESFFLKKPLELLEKGQAVVMFPQGTRRKNLEIAQAQPGVAVLAIETNSPILPVAILDSAPGSIKKFLLRQRRIRVRVGQAFSLQERLGRKKQYSRDDFKKGTEIIMAEIKKLLEQEK